MKHVDLEKPATFLGEVYLGCTQRECKPNTSLVDDRKLFESRISAGATEDLPDSGKSESSGAPCCTLSDNMILPLATVFSRWCTGSTTHREGSYARVHASSRIDHGCHFSPRGFAATVVSETHRVVDSGAKLWLPWTTGTSGPSRNTFQHRTNLECQQSHNLELQPSKIQTVLTLPYEFRVVPEEHPIVLTDALVNPRPTESS